MSSFRVRPRFRQIVPGSRDEVQRRLAARLAEQNPRFELKNFEGFLCLRIPEEDRHYWTPRLNLSLDATEDGNTCIEGIYGPNAQVWGMFFYAYLITGVGGMFAGFFGLAQCLIGHHPWGLWIFGGLAAVALGLYLLAQFGQKLAAAQTFLLHYAYEAAIGERADLT